MLLNRIQEWRRITGQVIDHVTKIFTTMYFGISICKFTRKALTNEDELIYYKGDY